MKVILKDKRNNPRIIYIDGKRYVLPSNKEVIKEISRKAYLYLLQCSWIEVKKYIEPKVEESKTESSTNEVKNESKEKNNKTEEKLTEENTEYIKENTNIESKENEIKPMVDSVVDSKESFIKEDIPATNVVEIVENIDNSDENVETVVSEKTNEVENTIDYSSMSKKELRAIIEEKGGDTTGMSKANMLDWLKNN